MARGKKKPNAKGVVQLDNGRYVQHALETTEQMTIALIDFSDLKHNTMPEPDRTKDNSTYWTPDFSVQHYKDMLFTPGGGSYGNPSLTDFYQELSSGRFAWNGQVSNWTAVNGTKADFGANSEESGDGGDDANGPVSRVVKATLDGLAASGNYGAASTSPRSTRPTATTATTTATSTSPTATSTTSAWSTRARARTPTAAPTRSGATAPMPTRTTSRARPAARWAATSSAAPASGSATTRSRPRTAARACSPTSSATISAWQDVTGTLPAGTTAYRLRYWTDGAAGGEGIAVSDVKFGSTDDTMNDTSAFDLGGWRKVTGGQFTDTFHHWYLAENRSPTLQDRSLCGAYQFTTESWVEKHCYAKGILVWYRNEGVRDNNTFFHPGQGEILPVDSHPDRMITPDGKFLWGGRWQAWDAPFSLDRQQITLVQSGVGSKTYTAEPVTTFWDSSPKAYYRDNLKYNSVMTAGSGVRLRVLDANKDRSVYAVQVDKK